MELSSDLSFLNERSPDCARERRVGDVISIVSSILEMIIDDNRISIRIDRPFLVSFHLRDVRAKKIG